MLNTNEYSPLNAIPAGNSNTILSIPLFGSFRYSRKAMIVSVNPEPNAAINPEIDVIFSSFIFLTMRTSNPPVGFIVLLIFRVLRAGYRVVSLRLVLVLGCYTYPKDILVKCK